MPWQYPLEQVCVTQALKAPLLEAPILETLHAMGRKMPLGMRIE